MTEQLENKIKMLSNSNMIKQCLMCKTIYEGGNNYTKNSDVSHGICLSPDCKSAYIMHSFSCNAQEAEEILKEVNPYEPNFKPKDE